LSLNYIHHKLVISILYIFNVTLIILLVLICSDLLFWSYLLSYIFVKLF